MSIRQDHSGRRIPVLVFTGKDRRALCLEALEDRTTPALTFPLPSHQELVQGGYLTGSSAETPLEIAVRYFNGHSAEFGFAVGGGVNGGMPIGATAAATSNGGYRVTDQYSDPSSGMTYLYLRQVSNGLDVLGADLNINITAEGRVLSAGGGFVQDATSNRTPGLSPNLLDPIAAVKAAAARIGIAVAGSFTVVQNAVGVDSESLVRATSISLDDIPVRQVYVPISAGTMRLAWNLVIRTPDGDHWYNLAVDAKDGSLLMKSDWVDEASYDVLAFPTKNPDDASRTIVTNPQNATASPFGWHDTNGVAGAEFTDTRGNNVVAQEDVDANNSGGFRPNGGASLNFDFPLNLAGAPNTYQGAAVTNLFYWNNILHDIHYQYGFNEAAGNFQTNNYGHSGNGNDAVFADAQDGSGVNNANFATPPDGQSPRMQMYAFDRTNPGRDGDLDSAIIIHEFGHGVSNRLTGGPANADALSAQQSGGMGEGWSDWWSLMFLQRSSDTKMGSFGVGTYVLGQPLSGPGIRHYPYSFDKSINPLTLGSYNSNPEVHAAGEIWCSALWDLNWLLIDKYGYSNDLYNASGTAGNIKALKLIMEGLKLQPSNPSFLQARDAILAADQSLFGGANQQEIWNAFARRGMGYSATDGGSNSTFVHEAFDLPPTAGSKLVTLGVSGSPFSENGGTATVTATLSAAVAQPVTVNLSFSGTASAGDYSHSNTVIIIAAGSTSGSITLTGINDSQVETTETVVIDITSVVNANESGVQQVTASILDDDGAVGSNLVGIDFDSGSGTSPANWNRYTGGTTDFSLNNLKDESGATTAIDLTISSMDGFLDVDTGTPELSQLPQHSQSLSGLDGNIYDTSAVLFTFSDLVPGAIYEVYLFGLDGFANSQLVTIQGSGAAIVFQQSYLPNQLFVNGEAGSSSRTLSSYAKLVSADNSGVVRIEVDRQSAYLGVGGLALRPVGGQVPTVALGLTGSPFAENGGTATVTATLSSVATQTVTVNLGFSGTATAADYSKSATFITIAAGSTSGSITLTGLNDAAVEGNETVEIDIASVVNGTELGNQHATAVITDDDSAPVTGALVGVDFDVFGGSSPNFWTPFFGGDTPTEAFNLFDETGNATAIDLTLDSGDGTLETDVGAVTPAQIPQHSQSLAGVDGNIYGSSFVNFIWSDLTPGVTYEIFVFGLDTTDDAQSVTITGAGTPISFQQAFNADQLFINDQVGNSNRTLSSYAKLMAANSQGTITISVSALSSFFGVAGLAIRPAGSVPNSVSLSLAGSPFAENGGVATVTASLSAVSTQNVTVNLGFTGSATNSSDYSASSSSIVIPAGSLSASMTLTGLADAAVEGNETVIVDIIGVTNGVEQGTQQVTATILDQIAPPNVSLSLQSNPFAENGGVGSLVVTLSSVSTQDVTVMLALSGTAVPGVDFSYPGALVVIPAGSLSKNVPLTAIDDTIYEGTETVVFDIASVQNGAEQGVQQVTASITDNEQPPNVVLSVAGSPFSENGGVATITATLSNVAALNVVITLGLTGTATKDVDYSVTSSVITILAGSLTGSVSLNGLTDAQTENSETVVVDILNVSNGTEQGVQQVTATLLDVGTSSTGVLIGVDFDVVGGTVPQNWNQYTGGSTPFQMNNLINESGTSTQIDLSISTPSSFANSDVSAPSAAQLPVHSPSLSGLGGDIWTNGVTPNPASATFIWSDLSPGLSYEVYVFGLDTFANSQTVTLTGGGQVVSFNQTYEANQFFVNDQLGSSSRTLDSYAKLVTADSAGHIRVQVTAQTAFVGIGGLAIRAIGVPIQTQPTVTLSSSSGTWAENGGQATVTATLSATSTQAVTVALDFSGSATLGTDYNASANSIVIQPGSLTGSVTLTAIDDFVDESDEVATVGISSVTNGIPGVSASASVTIHDDDIGAFVSGTNGNDVIQITTQSGVVFVTLNGVLLGGYSGSGPMTIDCLAGNDNVNVANTTISLILRGGDGSDTLVGGSGNDRLEGGADDDFLFALGGNDCLVGGDGNDGLDGGDQNDTIQGDAGSDYIVGGNGDDSLLGGTENDGFDAGAGNDFIDGGIGNDFMYGFAGNDTMLGEDGADGMDAGAGADVLDGGAGDDFMYGLDGNDTMTGNDGNDGMDGGTGDDSMFGGNGNDLLFGNFGNDYELGGAGSDSIDGNAGNDTLDGSSDNDVIFASGGGIDHIFGGDGNDTLQNIDAIATIVAGTGNDVLYGANFTNDSLVGEDGNDLFFGLSGNDTIVTGNGSDTVDGGSGVDFVLDATSQDILFNVP